MFVHFVSAEHVVEESETCGKILTALSWVLVCLTMPFSLFVCFKVVQEYERAVIFRLGRLLSGGAKGPDFPQDCATKNVLRRLSIVMDVRTTVSYRHQVYVIVIRETAKVNHSQDYLLAVEQLTWSKLTLAERDMELQPNQNVILN
ncbi:hypothetical protein HHI36_018595 [Cryptolaemus montrouzieri]|uniref:Uncharacterized protein n=1 Tax=Cryptolaemus montrouzieri TaxID=559131 RepID=A0ABD2P0T1_9CUCU